MNNMGESLEFFVKDLFCDSFNISEIKKNKAYSHNFSYCWTQNSPPDIMIKNWDAIEVKKLMWLSWWIALNSSYPKDKLHSDSPMITKWCVSCEKWTKKDLLYVIWVISNKKLSNLFFIYWDCFAADKEVYENIKKLITDWVINIPDIEFSETKELWRVNKVDPLGITSLRIRWMWQIENPIKIFEYITWNNKWSSFSMNTIILSSKYNSFPKKDIKTIESIKDSNFSIKDIEIKSPNNPSKLLKAKLISYAK